MTAVDLRMRCTLSHPWRQASRWTIKPTLEATDSIKLGHWTLYCHSVPKWQLQGDCRYLRYPPLLPAHLPTSSFPHDSLPALATGNLHRVFRRHHHTDAAHPAIYGMAECLAYPYVFPLTGAWLRLHVTVMESAGACLDFLVFPRRFPLALFCNETDASAAHAMVLGRSKSPTLKKMYSLLRNDPYFQAAAQRSTSQQVSGIANMTRDAGSRGHVEALRTYSAAMKMNIVVVELSEHELGFMAAILEATLVIGEALLVHPEPGTAMDVTEEAPLWQQLEPRPTSAASMVLVPGFDYGGEAQEVIRYMLRAASPERYRAGSLERQASDRRSPGCKCVAVASAGAPASRLGPRPCTSEEGHRWLENCHYEPVRCGAVWCGQVGCEAATLCDCADPADCARVGSGGEPSVRTCHSSPGLAPGNFLSAGETRLVTAPVSPILCGSELREACPLSPRMQLQRAPVASPVMVRESPVAQGGHMRPRTAAALRQLGTSKLVAKLAMDESDWALLPHAKGRLSEIVQAVAAAKLAAIPFNSARADDNGVRWLGLVCEDLDTTPLRPGPEHAFEDREALLGANFVCFHAEHAKVNPHTSRSRQVERSARGSSQVLVSQRCWPLGVPSRIMAATSRL